MAVENIIVGTRFAAGRDRMAAEIAFGAACAGGMVIARWALDLWAPASGPFALIYPTVLLATLFGRYTAGLTAFVICFVWAWWLALPYAHSFSFQNADDPPRVAINAACGLIVLLFAESFRAAVAHRTAQRDAEIARRTVLQTELEHRTKNNFALVASLLDTQARRQDDAAVREALALAVNRVRSFAGAYDHLGRVAHDGRDIAVRPYLIEMIDEFLGSSFEDHITIRREIADFQLPAEQAVAMCLLVNEALTNCAKYAFEGRPDGIVEITLTGPAEDWRLEVRDDGVGGAHATGSTGSSGIGNALMKAFAAQARAELSVETRPDGTCVRLVARAD